MEISSVEFYSGESMDLHRHGQRLPTHYYIQEKGLLKVAQCLNWFTKEQITLWFFEDTNRSRRIEVLLPRLVNKKPKPKLIKKEYGHRFVYVVPRLARSEDPQINHGLGVTEGLVRFYISDRSGEIIPPRKFEGLGARPEWGLKYGDKILLYEFCTADNSERMNVLRNKVRAYRSLKSTVLFVMDIPRERVIEIIKKLKPEGPFMFTDYETFKCVPYTHQFTQPIYIWGEDLNVYPLRNESHN